MLRNFEQKKNFDINKETTCIMIVVKARREKYTMGPSIYYVSKGLGGWVQKMASFADAHYCTCADIVGGSKKNPTLY